MERFKYVEHVLRVVVLFYFFSNELIVIEKTVKDKLRIGNTWNGKMVFINSHRLMLKQIDM